MKINRKTNVEFVRDLMEYSDYGALVQGFVIEALSNYSRQIIQSTLPEENYQFISPIAWKGIAKELLQKIETNYGKVSDGKLNG